MELPVAIRAKRGVSARQRNAAPPHWVSRFQRIETLIVDNQSPATPKETPTNGSGSISLAGDPQLNAACDKAPAHTLGWAGRD